MVRAGPLDEAWDETISSIFGPTQRALRTPEWVDHHEHLVVCGPSGTGKSRPPPGSSAGHHRGALVAVPRQKPLAVDSGNSAATKWEWHAVVDGSVAFTNLTCPNAISPS